MAGVDFDPFGFGFELLEQSPPPLAEQMYVGEYITITGGHGYDGTYEIVGRTPTPDGLRLVVQPSIHTD